jgi:Tfp pilus assembly protein PilW
VIPSRRNAGFTVAELIIGVSLSLIVMTAVLSSYVFVARAYTRTIGFGVPNQPTLEAQGRRTLTYFSQDVEMTSAIGSPSASEVTLTVPNSLGGTKNVTYYYNSTSAAVSIYSVTVLANSLARIDRATNTALTLHTSLLTCVFTYYDDSGNPYTAYTDYLKGIKQVSMVFTSRLQCQRHADQCV